MALPIIERPLYGQIQLETSAWASTFTWVDRTSTLVNGISYAEGGRVTTPGQSAVDAGTLNATFKNASTIPAVGDLIRIRRYGTSEYFFVGYVQDVSQRIVFDNSVTLVTPITLTTIQCADWVGYLGQFQAVGVGGANPTTGADLTNSYYLWESRPAALNKIVDPTYNTKIISATATGTAIMAIGDSDVVATIAEHLDIVSTTMDLNWYGLHALPTNKTTGRTSLVEIRERTSLVSSGKTFTDVAGTSGQLHYTEIDLENTSQNVANTVIVNNRTRIGINRDEIVQIGGFNEANFVTVNNAPVVGVCQSYAYKASDSTSITTYGVRQAELETTVAVRTVDENLIANPSAEYSDDGYFSAANSKVKRRRPSKDVNPFTAYNGLWAMRTRMTSAANNARVTYDGGTDTLPVNSNQFYRFFVYAARGTVSRTDVRCFVTIEWFNDADASISSTSGSNVSLTTANTWYVASHTAISPATAVRAEVRIGYERSGGGAMSVGDLMWVDAFHLNTNPASTNTYFDGDTPWTNDYGYVWTGGVGASPTIRVENNIDDVANNFLAKYSTTSMRASRIRWNAQEDLTSVSSLTVGKTISLVYDGTTTQYQIVGIDGNIDTDRYMIDYYLVKA